MPWRRLLLLCALTACEEPLAIHGTTVLGDSLDRRGPYEVLSAARGAEEVILHLQAGAGEDRIAMTALRDQVYRGAIPGQPPFTRVRYYVEARRGEERAADPPGAPEAAGWYGFWVVGSSCDAEEGCGPGERCDASGVCRQPAGPCTTDEDCGKGWRCGPLATCRVAARPCLLDEACLPGEVCGATLRECIPRPICSATRVCPLDFLCDEARGVCRRACAGEADCGPGEGCAAGICTGARACRGAADCPVGLICDPLLDYCRPEGAGLCAVCGQDTDCGAGTDFCLLLGTGQFCGRDCATAACPAGYACVTTVSPPQCAPLAGTCP